MSDTIENTGKDDLFLITLHLARCRDFPDGSSSRGYRFIAPLDLDNRIDTSAWRGRRQRCVVNRFWDDQPGKSGHLAHKAGGAGGAAWSFDYADAGAEDIGKHLEDHRFRPGEYVSIRQEHGDWTPFKVTDVRLVQDP